MKNVYVLLSVIERSKICQQISLFIKRSACDQSGMAPRQISELLTKLVDFEATSDSNEQLIIYFCKKVLEKNLKI